MSNAAQVVQTGECSNITITTSEGKVYNLGKPTSRLFRIRLWLYKKKRGIR